MCDSVSASLIIVSQQTAFVGDTVIVEVGCDPQGSYIKGWEVMLLEYNSTILQANSVTMGSFFDGFTQFPILGEINDSGKIVNIYNLIMAKKGNTSRSGQLFFVNFTALKAGNTSITISKVGICNESVYKDFTLTQGWVNVSEKDWIVPPPPVNDSNETIPPPVNDTVPPLPDKPFINGSADNKRTAKNISLFVSTYTIGWFVGVFVFLMVVAAILVACVDATKRRRR